MKKEIYLRIDGNGNYAITRRLPKTRIGEAIIKLILNYTPPKIYTLEYNIPTPSIPTDIIFEAPQTGLHYALAQEIIKIDSIGKDGVLSFLITEKGIGMANLAGKIKDYEIVDWVHNTYKISNKVVISIIL